MKRNKNPSVQGEISPLMQTVSAYIARAAKKALPPAVTEVTKHHLLDTLAAMVSGADLIPGKTALAYIKKEGGTREACIPGSRIVTTATNAAFAGAMLAHADETDDSHAPSGIHPGCGVVPAALAMGERVHASGTALLRAVALGYDIGTRLSKSLGHQEFFNAGHCIHGFGTLFGAAAAAGSLAGLNVAQSRYLLSYAGQSASGLGCWGRDSEHIEKAFDFSGKSARDGVAIACMVAAGFTGVDDVFSGDKSFYLAFPQFAKPEILGEGLGVAYEVMNTNIKRWTTGSPTQAPLDSLFDLINTHKLKAADIEKVIVRVSHHGFRVTNNRAIPDISMQHLVGMMLVDGTVTFASSHDMKRLRDPRILELRRRIEFYGDDELQRALPARHGIVELTLRDGRTLRHHTTAVRGSAQNPATREEIDHKCYELLAPTLGKKRARSLIDAVWDIERVKDVRTLRRLLMA